MKCENVSLETVQSQNDQLFVWIKELLKHQAKHVSKPTLKKILGACGEKCPFSHLPDHKVVDLKNNSENESDFLDSLCEEWRLTKEGDTYIVVFDQCYCPLVTQDTQKTSKALCYCTLGNIKRKFAIGLGRYVDVVMEGTILAGDNECRFAVKV